LVGHAVWALARRGKRPAAASVPAPDKTRLRVKRAVPSIKECSMLFPFF